jgi:hypothetical protein
VNPPNLVIEDLIQPFQAYSLRRKYLDCPFIQILLDILMIADGIENRFFAATSGSVK